MLQADHDSMAATAARLAARGWYVFPIVPGGKKPAVPDDWEHRAQADPAYVEAAWPSPRHNIGLACGPSRLVVIDLDFPKTAEAIPVEWRRLGCISGHDTFHALADGQLATVPDTYTVRTPSGGEHRYFTAPAGRAVRNSASKLAPCVDVRGQGGYVVAAGSVVDGTPYTVLRDVPVAAMPGWLVELADPPPPKTPPRRLPTTAGNGYAAAALRNETDRVRQAVEGTRNHTLNCAAFSLGQLVGAGLLGHADVVAALTDAGIDAGLGAREVTGTVARGVTAGAAKPRTIPERGVA